MRLFLLLLAASPSLAQFNETTCHDQEFQEEAVMKDMKEWADLAAAKAEAEDPANRARFVAIQKLIFDSVTNRRELRKRLFFVLKEGSKSQVELFLEVNYNVDENTKHHDKLQEYVSKCNLTETGAFGEAVAKLQAQAMEELYANATEEQRMEIVKKIAEGYKIFDWEPLPTPLCLNPEHLEQEMAKQMKEWADDISFELELHTERLFPVLSDRLSANYYVASNDNKKARNHISSMFQRYKLTDVIGESPSDLEEEINQSHKMHDTIHRYRTKCNLSETQYFNDALIGLFNDVIMGGHYTAFSYSAVNYAAASDEERMGIVLKQIEQKKNGVL